MDLTDEQWAIVEPLLPKPVKRADGKGRPRVDNRAILNGNPERLIGDRAYDSDPLDEKLAEKGILLIAPHKSNRKKPKTQDGRELRRYRRRWKV